MTLAQPGDDDDDLMQYDQTWYLSNLLHKHITKHLEIYPKKMRKLRHSWQFWRWFHIGIFSHTFELSKYFDCFTSWNLDNYTGCCQQQMLSFGEEQKLYWTHHDLSVAGGGAGGDCLRSSQFQESGAAVATCLPATNTLLNFSPLCAF